jgi:Na+/H+-dicarboxylate symporter
MGADRIMDSMRGSVDLPDNCVATFCVANWEGQLDKDGMCCRDGAAANRGTRGYPGGNADFSTSRPGTRA